MSIVWRSQEPIAAALFGCCVLRRMAARMSRTMRAQSSAFRATSDECEAFATALLEHCADTSEELAETLLVRRVRCLGERTVLQLAQSAEALKFISSSVVQVIYYDTPASGPYSHLLCAYLQCSIYCRDSWANCGTATSKSHSSDTPFSSDSPFFSLPFCSR